MKPVRVLLSLSLFVCLRAFAAGPVITLETDGTWATVPPGHRVAWAMGGDWYGGALLEDSDHDGRVHLTTNSNSLPPNTVVADVETGEWTSLDIEEAALLPYTVVPGPSGAYTQIYTPLLGLYGVGYWIRPGIGAWFLPVFYGGRSDPNSYSTGMIVDTTTILPSGPTPATPAGVERGDLLFIVGDGKAYLGSVDAQIDAPPSPGSITFAYRADTARETETRISRVMRLGGTGGTVSVLCSASSSTAEAGVDYAFDPTVITFAPGETIKTVSLPILNDGAYNLYPRTVDLNLSEVTGGATLGGYVTKNVKLTDDDPRPAIAFGDLPGTVEEGDVPWVLDIPFGVTGAFRGGPLPVTFTSGTTSVSHLLTPAQPTRVEQLTIPANDKIADGNRQVSLHLSSTLLVGWGDNRSITIKDDDPPPLIVDDASGPEGSIVSVPYRTEWTPYQAGQFTLTTADGSAIAGTDYQAKSSSCSTSNSRPSFEIRLWDTNQTVDGPKTFYVDISNITGPILPPARTRIAVTIYDDDSTPPPVSITTTPTLEGTKGAGQVTPTTVRVQLTQPATSYVTVLVTPGGGSATESMDYISFNHKLVFAPGEVTKDVTIDLKPDSGDEDDETLIIHARDQQGNLLGSTTLTILDDDTQSFVSAADTSVDEKPGAPVYATFRVTFSKAPVVSGTFQYTTVDLTATAGQDYLATSGTIAFGPGDLSREIRVQVLDDAWGELTETFQLQLSNITGAGMYLQADRATATIRDDDSAITPVVFLSAIPPIEGNSGLVAIPLHVQLATALSTPVTISLATAGGTAAAASDYTPLATSVTFAAGETAKVASLMIQGDTLDENDETIIVNAMLDGATVATLTLTILDDDTSNFASIVDTSVLEKTGTSAMALFTITFTPPPGVAGTIQYSTENGTAGAADFAPKNGSLSFAAGQTQLQISVEVFGDAIAETDEKFSLRLFNASGVSLSDDRAVATIYDDDVAVVRPTVAIQDINVRESNGWTEATFKLQLSEASSETVKVSYETADASATSPADYERGSGVVTFAAGETSRTIVLQIAGDTTHEETETFTLWLSNGDGVVLPDLQAICTIVDDDPDQALGRRRSARH